MSRRWLQLFIVLAILGISKAHGFIKLIILAILGLAGLWLLHTLAQDYTQIQGGQGGGNRLLYKRSIEKIKFPAVNWDTVLARDPAKCVRSYICQLSTFEVNTLDDKEKFILQLTRQSSKNDTWASKQLQEALHYGEKSTNPLQCLKIYKLCPFTKQAMTFLLNMIGR